MWKHYVSLENVGLSGSEEGRSSIFATMEMLHALLQIAKDSASDSEDAAMTNSVILTLVNLTAELPQAQRLHEISKEMQPVYNKYYHQYPFIINSLIISLSFISPVL